MTLFTAKDLEELEKRPFWPHLQTQVGQPILEVIHEDWNWLLQSTTAKEHEYQAYLSEHAGFFFASRSEIPLVLSKISLGSGLETDFVVCTDNRSRGFSYEFVEIEVPHTPPYTKDGNPHSRLTHAIQQIEDWRHWLAANREEAKRLFPSPGFVDRDTPNFRFTVVIGTRENSERWVHKRNEWAERQNVSIRSFDAFADALQSRVYLPVALQLTNRMVRLPIVVLHEMANPFFTALSHSKWSDIRKEPKFERRFHMLEANAEILLKYRKLNSRYDDFVRILQELPDDEKNYFRLWLATAPRSG